MSVLTTVLITAAVAAAVALVLIGPTLGPRRRSEPEGGRHEDAPPASQHNVSEGPGEGLR